MSCIVRASGIFIAHKLQSITSIYVLLLDLSAGLSNDKVTEYNNGVVLLLIGEDSSTEPDTE